MTSKNENRADRSRRLLSTVVIVAAVALVLFAAQSASACPSCKAALANQDGKGDLVTGMMYSILFMLSMPFAIFGSFSGYFYYLVRQARRQQKTGETPVGDDQSGEVRGS